MNRITTIPTSHISTHVVYVDALKMQRVERMDSRDENEARRNAPAGCQYFYFYDAVGTPVPGTPNTCTLRADIGEFYFM
ncbi:MAG TPA: hypothetical protein VFL85_02655 [Candidatus Saccharimonadales bacterium]|nr:hypothetical protein [Candidatus Saccharimonadales bacterium]